MPNWQLACFLVKAKIGKKIALNSTIEQFQFVEFINDFLRFIC